MRLEESNPNYLLIFRMYLMLMKLTYNLKEADDFKKKIYKIKLKDIVDFKDYQFFVSNDESLKQLVVSIKNIVC